MSVNIVHLHTPSDLHGPCVLKIPHTVPLCLCVRFWIWDFQTLNTLQINNHSAVRRNQGSISERGFSENSESVNPKIKGIKRLSLFHKRERANVNCVSYCGNLVREPNLVRSRFPSRNLEFLSVSSPLESLKHCFISSFIQLGSCRTLQSLCSLLIF